MKRSITGTVLAAVALFAEAPAGLAQSVRGTVVDRISGAPISGVTVVLLTADHERVGATDTDADGRYALDADVDGDYLLLAEITGYTTVVSPTLALSAGLTTQHAFEIVAFTATEDAAPDGEIEAQTLARALAYVCGEVNDPGRHGILVGVVRDSLSALPLPDVTARLEWPEDNRLRTREVVTGDDGAFVFCDAPEGRDRRVTGRLAGLVGASEPFEVNAGMIKRKDVFLSFSSAERPGDVMGRITDHDTGEPISGASVRIVEADVRATTDHNGQFSITGVPWGVYFFEVDHIAYEAQRRPFRIIGDQAHVVEMRMATEAMELDPLSVSVESRDWAAGMRGFRDRRFRGFGYFLEAEDIEKEGSIRVLDILREIPGVNVEMARSNVNSPGRTTTQALYFRNCWRYGEGGSPIYTPPVFYLNGVKQISLDVARGDLDTVRLQDIAAIEVYRGAAEMPADYGGSDAGCGVIAIWTKRG